MKMVTPRAGYWKLPARRNRPTTFSATASWRSFSRARDIGTRPWTRIATISPTISPKTSTGRASRPGDSPAACIATSSLSPARRLVP